VRRTVATLLFVASPLLLAAPVGAREGRITGLTSGPSATAGTQPAFTPAWSAASSGTVTPAAPGPATVSPAIPGPAAALPSVAGPAWVPAAARTATAAVRPAVRALRAKAPAPAALDAAYEAQLRADLCQARAIFCGLDRSGHYPAG
jgi:hypothetical protein